MSTERDHTQGVLFKRVPTVPGQLEFSLLGVHRRIELLNQEVVKGDFHDVRDETGVSGLLPAVWNWLIRTVIMVPPSGSNTREPIGDCGA